MSFICLWLASAAIRLMLNKPNHSGLLSPLVLRLVAIYLVALPIFLMVTGGSSDWPYWRYLQAVSFIASGIALWRTAVRREASHLRA